jgi:hypothetical protein
MCTPFGFSIQEISIFLLHVNFSISLCAKWKFSQSSICLQGCLCVRPSVTFDMVHVRLIRVNVLLTLDRVNLDLFCPQWLPHRCHVGWSGLLGAHTANWGAHTLAEGHIRLLEGRIRLAEGPPQPFVPPRECSRHPLCHARSLHMLEMLVWKSTSPLNMPYQPTVLMRSKI